MGNMIQKKRVAFEDSPAGNCSGVASGAIVIQVAVCTSHERSKIENHGAHYVVENVTCELEGDRLKLSLVVWTVY
jgi:beta-phosphoglucomutase-like phosphatase (HAD superfamily)